MIDKDIASKVIETTGVGPRTPEPDDRRFEKICLQWIQEWVKSSGASVHNQGACVFIFDPSRPPQSIMPEAKICIAFKDSHPEKLAGYAFVCSSTMAKVYKTKMADHTLDVPEVFDWIDEHGCGSALAIVFLPKHLKIFTKSLGLGMSEDAPIACVQLDGSTPKNTFHYSQIDKILEHFFYTGVMTHRGNCRVWANQEDRELVTDPEDMVQRCLYQTLLTHIDLERRGVTKAEVQNVNGREDIEIIVNNNGNYEISILELKVLFPKKGPKANKEWALAGIQQALDYKAANHLQDVVSMHTCLYDGRKKDEAMPEFFSEAEEKGVNGRRYFMETDGVPREIDSFTQ